MSAAERAAMLVALRGHAGRRPVNTKNVAATYGVSMRTAQRILHELEQVFPDVRRVRPLVPYTVSAVTDSPRVSLVEFPKRIGES